MSKYSAIGIAAALLIFTASMAAGALCTFSQPVVFETQARVWIQPKLSELALSSWQTSLFTQLNAFFNSPIVTAGEVMKSDIVLQEAARTLKNEVPGSGCPTVDDLRAGLSVAALGNADVLFLRFRYKEGNACAAALRNLIGAYVKEISLQSAQSPSQSRIVLEKQLKQAQEANSAAREKLKRFQSENNAVDLPAQVMTDIRQIAELESEIRKTESEIDEQRSRVAHLASQTGIKPQDVTLVERILHDEIITALRSKIAHDETELIETKSQMPEDQAHLVYLRQSLQTRRQALKERLSQLFAAAGHTLPEEQIYGIDPVREKLLTDLVDAKTGEVAREARLASLKSAFARAKSGLRHIPEQQLRLAELRLAVDLSTANLTDTERNLNAVRLIESISNRISTIQVLDGPTVPRTPVQPPLLLNLAVAAIVGLVLATGTFFAVYLFDPSVQRIGQVVSLLPIPLLGGIRSIRGLTPMREVLPGIDRLRLALKPWIGAGCKRIVITSSDPEDGKTMLCSGLSLSLSQSGLRVILVDTNLIHPTLDQVFNVKDAAGLTDYLASGKADLLPQIACDVKENLKVVPAGKSKTIPGVLESQIFRRMIEQLESQTDVLILDTPAAAQSIDALSMLDQNVILLVVARMSHSRRASLRSLAANLRGQHTNNAGIVLVDADERALIDALAARPPSAVASPGAVTRPSLITP